MSPKRTHQLSAISPPAARAALYLGDWISAWEAKSAVKRISIYGAERYIENMNVDAELLLVFNCQRPTHEFSLFILHLSDMNIATMGPIY